MYHIDINGPLPRGPFSKISASPTATYPCLWSHDAQKESRMVCVADSQLQVRPGMEEKAATVWATASRTHLNRDFRFNSQPLAAAFTEQASIGGRAWPNVIFEDKRFDYAFHNLGKQHIGVVVFLVVLQSPSFWPGHHYDPLRRVPSHPGLRQGSLQCSCARLSRYSTSSATRI